MADKHITIHLVIKDNENKEEIKKIVEEVLEEKTKQSMRLMVRGFDSVNRN